MAGDEWDAGEESIGDDARYPSPFSEAEPTKALQGWVLEIDELTGRKSEG